MSKLNVDQKTVKELFEHKKADFLIPDYQRPYAWEEKECQTLWDDIFSFAFPDNDRTKFDNNNEYYLGPIVTYKNEDSKQEIIDGQQRLTTLMLLLRSFYDKFSKMNDEDSKAIRTIIERCIWKTDDFDRPIMTELKINSDVATDNAKDEFLYILKEGAAPRDKNSNYAINFRFFQDKIEKFLHEFPSYFPYLPMRILNNCILLPIEAESQDTALRIFSTLNDRGKPLSDADIFKAQFYKYYSKIGKKDKFVEKWKLLEELCEKIFQPVSGTPMDELFTKYMYYVRAKMGIKSTTTEALRKFYERDNYRVLKNEETFENLITLANFWNDVLTQNAEVFSNRILRKLFVLHYAPNGMWTYFISVYFMHNKDENNLLQENDFYNFLEKITAFIWAYAMTNPGVNALRTPVYAEMVNIVNDKPVEFCEFKFDKKFIINILKNFSFSNIRPITKSMLAWWAFTNKNQELLDIETVFEIEHIYSRNRYNIEHSLSDEKILESLGNKSLLEKSVNIRASDFRFADKQKYYQGFRTKQNQDKKGTNIYELKNLAKFQFDYTEENIINRFTSISNKFINYLVNNNLIK